ncbi:hypothetical protein BH09PSE4_BH09PSE4_11090 [soil metagenome]
MTGSKVSEPGDWGAQSDRQRARDRRRYAVIMAGVGVAFPFALVKIFGPAGGNHPIVTTAIVIVYLAAMAFAAFTHWRRRDEVEQRMAIEMLAVIGTVSVVLFPLGRLVEHWLPVRDMAVWVWVLSVGAGAIFYAVRRVRSAL